MNKYVVALEHDQQSLERVAAQSCSCSPNEVDEVVAGFVPQDGQVDVVDFPHLSAHSTTKMSLVWLVGGRSALP